jgi:hypothetical protein
MNSAEETLAQCSEAALMNFTEMAALKYSMRTPEALTTFGDVSCFFKRNYRCS